MEEYRLVWFQHLHKAAGTYVIRRAIANGERLFPNNENGNPCNHNGVIPLWEMSEKRVNQIHRYLSRDGGNFCCNRMGEIF